FAWALERAGYDTLRATQADARRAGRHVGIGLAYVVEKSGLGPWESARVAVDATGAVVVHTGITSVGRGVGAGVARVCAGVHGGHVAMVEVDAETGAVRILRYAVVHDIGRAINPMLVEAQIMGGLAQGLGAALHEELTYDDAGQLTAGTLMEYHLPAAADLPP